MDQTGSTIRTAVAAALGLGALTLLCTPAIAEWHAPSAHVVVPSRGGAGWHGGGYGWHGGGYGWHGGGYGWHGGGWRGGLYIGVNPFWGWGWPYDYGYGYGYGYPYGYYYPQTVVVQGAPAADAGLGSLPAPPVYWYYCDAAGAYYPYVRSCPAGWRPVAATPPPPPAPPPGSAPAPR